MAHLTELQEPQAIKFKNWVEHSIALPSRTVRKRKGIGIADATRVAQDLRRWVQSTQVVSNGGLPLDHAVDQRASGLFNENMPVDL